MFSPVRMYSGKPVNNTATTVYTASTLAILKSLWMCNVNYEEGIYVTLDIEKAVSPSGSVCIYSGFVYGFNAVVENFDIPLRVGDKLVLKGSGFTLTDSFSAVIGGLVSS